MTLRLASWLACRGAYRFGRWRSRPSSRSESGSSPSQKLKDRCSASASTSRSTRTQQPPSSISIIPALVRCGGDAEAGGNLGTASSFSRLSPVSPERYFVRPFRYPRLRSTTIMVRAPRQFFSVSLYDGSSLSCVMLRTDLWL